MSTYTAEFHDVVKYFRTPFRYKKVVGENNQISFQSCDRSTPSTGCKFMDMVFDAINDGVRSEKTMAARLGVSDIRCLYTVQMLTGYTVLELAKQRNLFIARQLMQYTDMPLEKVARQCGISSVSHMCHLFRRFYGDTPNQVRRRSLRNNLIGTYRLNIE